jgi:hypothetical protein
MEHKTSGGIFLSSLALIPKPPLIKLVLRLCSMSCSKPRWKKMMFSSLLDVGIIAQCSAMVCQWSPKNWEKEGRVEKKNTKTNNFKNMIF